MTQAPTPGPLSAQHEEAIAFNLCAVHGFEPDFVKTQRDFALAVIREYEVVCRPRLAPTAPVEASGWERDIEGETFMGFRVAAWRYRQGDETDKLPHHYAEHWSTPGASAWGIQRLFTEDQLQQALALRPQPSGETREAVARELIRQHYGDRGYSELGIANIIEGELDGWLSKADAILALLSARPLALGGQQGEDFTSVHGLWKDQNLSRLERVRAHRFEFGSELIAALEAVDDEAARQSLANKSTAPLLARAREYVVDSLDAHEHSDGRDLLNEIDIALSTTPARAEAQDEGAAGEPVAYGADHQPWCQPGDQTDRAFRLRFEDPDMREMIWTGPDAEKKALAAYNQYAPSWNVYLFSGHPRAHPSPTPAADADRGVKAFNFINDLYRIKAEFPAIRLHGALKKAEALAALKSEGK